MNIKRQFLSVCMLVGALAAASPAQETFVSGAIRDANTYREIRDVNIYVKGTNLGVNSDFAGRYQLRIPGTRQNTIVVFRHVAYEPLEIAIDSLKAMRYVHLQPRVITLPGVEIREERGRGVEIDKELPLTTAVIEARNFEIRGYVDAGDLLRTDHSVQIDEELSGRKTVAIRGGNPDEVVILYNGIKLNSAYDNLFDLSLIDLEDVDKLEIIKGSNTAIYGPEAFSGVINIVPKLQQDYLARFQQRFGTYRSGNWGLHLHQRLNRLLGSYSVKRGGMRRNFVDAVDGGKNLENTSLHHTATLSYGFSQGDDSTLADILAATYIYSALNYENRVDLESLSNWNRLLSLKYTGDLASIKDIALSISLRRLDEEQSLAFAQDALQRSIVDRAIHANVEKRFITRRAEATLAYQFQNAELDFADVRNVRRENPVGLESAGLTRRQHGLVAIAKFHGEAGAKFLQALDFDISLRHDRVHDEQADPVVRGNDANGLFEENDWQETMFKFGVSLVGYRRDLAFSGYLNFGKNAKFPTLLQQVSAPDFSTGAASRPDLSPERNRSVEVGVVLTRDIRERTAIYGWQLSGNYFQNDYDNKFRMFAVPTIPIAFYDNVPNARLSGVEAKSTVFLLRKKVSVEFGLSRYFISDKAAFPFKSDFKRTVACNIDHVGYAFQLLWFKESEQAGWLRLAGSSVFSQINLPEHTNLDVHLSKKIEMGKLKLFANVSGRNLLNEDVVLQGLALRDRRFYVTVGAQY